MKKNGSTNTMLLVILGGLILIACYKFAYADMNKKSEAIETEINSLNKVIIQREQYKKDANTYENQKTEAKKSKEAYLNQFKSKTETEDIISLANQIESIEPEKEGEQIAISISSVKVDFPVEVYSKSEGKVKGFSQTIEFGFENTSYEGFKKMVDYINSYGDRCNVVSAEAKYNVIDGLTEEVEIVGCLAGKIKFNMFYTQLEGFNRYTEPLIGLYEYGVTDPFVVNNSEILDGDGNKFMDAINDFKKQ